MATRDIDSGSYTLVYDAENRLVSATVGSETTAYTYDGDGTPAEKDRG